MNLSTTQATPFVYLRRSVQGSVVTPDDAGFDEARQAWHLGADQRPAAVALPENARDVAAACSTPARWASGSPRRAPATTRPLRRPRPRRPC